VKASETARVKKILRTTGLKTLRKIRRKVAVGHDRQESNPERPMDTLKSRGTHNSRSYRTTLRTRMGELHVARPPELDELNEHIPIVRNYSSFCNDRASYGVKGKTSHLLSDCTVAVNSLRV
jgi:hypothetical protein